MKKIIFLSLFIASAAISANLSENQKISDFNQLVYSIESGYGPLLYKANRGMDLKILKNQYVDKIKSTSTNAQFYYLLKQFISEFHDGHFRSQLPTDYKAEIPVMTDLVENKVLIDSINRQELSEKEFPFTKGDEIVTVDGRPVEEIVKYLASFRGSGYELSKRRRATMALFLRLAKDLPVPKESKIKVGIRHGLTQQIDVVELTWKFSGTYYDEKLETFTLSPVNQTTNLRMKDLYAPSDLAASPWRSEKSYGCSGTTRIAIPKDATKLIEEPFVAYYHPTPLGNIGYLRIPHYYWRKDDYNDLQNQDYERKVFEQYVYVIKKLEENTVGLVIDQDHNCGGSVELLEKMVSLFMDKPFKPLQFRFLASKSFYNELKNETKNIPDKTIDRDSLNEIMQLVRKSWENGEFLTPQSSFRASQLVFPNSIRYSKPIIMLIDEMSGSGGDAFPSLMKGYGRATLLGTRTMGLGGHVTDIPDLNYSGLKVSMTRSLFYRPDGVEVENNGAVPDIQYSPTREDFMNQYRDYQKFYLDKLSEILTKK